MKTEIRNRAMSLICNFTPESNLRKPKAQPLAARQRMTQPGVARAPQYGELRSFVIRHSSFAALLLACLLPSLAGAANIPDRPEKLTFPPFEFQPPKAETYRVPLKSGPVAYVVPDKELPL